MRSNLKDCESIKKFTRDCILNDCFKKELKIFLDHWNEAKSVNDFKKLVFNDERLKNHQGYAELSKESEGHEERLNEMFKNAKTYTTMSDCGSVALFTENYNEMTDETDYNVVLLNNGYGDGITNVAVFENDHDFNDSMMYSDTTLKGKWFLSDYDCECNAIAEIEADLIFTYYYNGYVAIVKC